MFLLKYRYRINSAVRKPTKKVTRVNWKDTNVSIGKTLLSHKEQEERTFVTSFVGSISLICMWLETCLCVEYFTPSIPTNSLSLLQIYFWLKKQKFQLNFQLKKEKVSWYFCLKKEKRFHYISSTWVKQSRITILAPTRISHV